MGVSRILCSGASRRSEWQSSLLGGGYPAPLAANPEVNGRAARGQLANRLPLLLSGLAPDGVYRGRPVTQPPVSSYLTISPLPAASHARVGRYVSVALSLGSPPLAVSQHPALWSSDFPRTVVTRSHAARDCLPISRPHPSGSIALPSEFAPPVL